jgi:DUF4097 and DUF4098 domain-containing protein YvlB
MTKRQLIPGLILLAVSLIFVGAASADVTFTKERGGYTARSVDLFDVSPSGKLDMRDLIGDVQVRGGNGLKAEVIQIMFIDESDEAAARKVFDRFAVSVTKSGSVINVTGPKSTFFRHAPEVKYQANVPTQFNANIETSGGDVEASDLEGTVELSTSGGDVKVNSLKGTVDVSTSGGNIVGRTLDGSVQFKTAGGDVELFDSKQGPFELKTAGGDIKIQRIIGAADAATAGGDVNARDVTGDLDLRTSGGSIMLQSVKGQNHSASTSGGDVEARDVEGNVDLKTSGGQVSAIRVKGNVYGRTSGGDMEVEAITGTTDITTSGGSLRITDIGGKLTGQTSGGDVSARVIKGGELAGPIRLSTSGGRVSIELPSDIKASVYAEIRVESNYDDYTIHSDFSSIKVEANGDKAERSRNRLITASGDINGGGLMIELKTAQSDIYIEKIN